MRWSFRIGTIGGIGVKIHVTFLLYLVLIAFRNGLFSGQIAGAVANVGLALAVFACVVLHELGHAFTARRYGIRTRDIVLLPIGGVARLERMPEKPSQEIRVAIAGPLVNVAIAAVLWVLRGRVIPLPVWDSIGPGILDMLIWINVGMVAFNLLPAFPMDGGRVLRAALALRMNFASATRIATRIGQVLAIGFALAGVYTEYRMLLLVGLFVFLAAGEEYAQVAARITMGGFPVRAAMATDFEVLEGNVTLRDAFERMRGGFQHDFPVIEGDLLIGVLSLGQLMNALRHHPPEARIADVIPRGVAVADPLEPLDGAYRRMLEGRQSALPVVSDGHLIGLVTTDNVAELMSTRELRRRAGTG